MTEIKTRLAILLGVVLVTIGVLFAVALKEPEVETRTETVSTTDVRTNTKTQTKTKTETSTPPPRTVTETQVARSADRTPVEAPKATTNAAPTPAPPANTSAAPQEATAPSGGIASCIAKYESGGNPKAENPSGASGLYQFMPGTWTAVTGLPPPASNYSVSVQTDAFHKLWNNGAGASHWVTAHKCGY